MNIEEIRDYCLSKKGVTEEFPFNPETLVFKVMGKMFALCGLESVPLQLSLKCEPERAEELRENFPEMIRGAYHMNKRHWNSLATEALPPDLVRSLIDHSYDLVVHGLTRRQKEQLETKKIDERP